METKKKIYPEWVEKHHTKGTSIKEIKGSYYLYSVTSYNSKDKPYPVSVQRYIGKITPEGLIEPHKVTFMPGMDKLILLKEAFDLSECKENDYELISTIPVFKCAGHIYTGKLSVKQVAAIERYFTFQEGEISFKS